MKLVIVSHTRHYRSATGIVGWGPTVREIDHLAELFREVVHIAPLHEAAAPESAMPYQSARVRVVAVRSAGGGRVTDKLGVLLRAPSWARAILREAADADVLHVRCPSGISLVTLALLPTLRRGVKRWIKYAGNWKPEGREPWTYRVQRRWLLSGRTRSVVTVNGEWPDQPPHVVPFVNPCLTEEELDEGRRAAEGKTLSSPVQLLFVGSLGSSKGAERALSALECVLKHGLEANLDVVGGGPGRTSFVARVEAAGIADRVRLHGWMPRNALSPLFARAHITLTPSETEGWPKVLSEAMAYGVVPVASRVSCIPQYLQRFGTGRTVNPHDMNGFADAIAWYIAHPSEWKRESQQAVAAARLFSYSRFLGAVRSLLDLPAERTAHTR